MTFAVAAIAFLAGVWLTGHWLGFQSDWRISIPLGLVLMLLAYTDMRRYLLPDILTIPLMLAGLAYAYGNAPETVPAHLIGALAGFFFIIAVAWGYRLIAKREGIGMGDAKLLAGIGTWLGWQMLPLAVLIASLLGLTMVGLLAAVRKRRLARLDRVPFGVFLAAAFWVLWILQGMIAPLPSPF